MITSNNRIITIGTPAQSKNRRNLRNFQKNAAVGAVAAVAAVAAEEKKAIIKEDSPFVGQDINQIRR